MFHSKTIEALKEEIAFLRGQVKDLQDRLMAYNSQSFNTYLSKEAMSAPTQAPAYMDFLGNIESITPKNEEEEKQKKDAIEQFHNLLGAIN